jgi:hypothetical protein
MFKIIVKIFSIIVKFIIPLTYYYSAYLADRHKLELSDAIALCFPAVRAAG